MDKNKCAKKCFLFLLPVLFILCSVSESATLDTIKNFGTNPSNNVMLLYVPDKVSKQSYKAPVLVAVHYCTGDGTAMYNGTTYATFANRYGFIVIYPSVNRSSTSNCWDINSDSCLTHNGGGDALGIVNMVKYVLKNYNADSTRVYVTGVSSGAMMTEVLIGSYPDVFKGGSAFAGVPFACFSGTSWWNSSCSTGKIINTAEEWGDLVRAAYPEYTGTRPRVQLWHGTLDSTVYYQNFTEAIKQWTNVLVVSDTPTVTDSNTPKNGYTRTQYKDSTGKIQVEAISEGGQPHNLEVIADSVITFFGLNDTLQSTSTCMKNQIDSKGAYIRIIHNTALSSMHFMISAISGDFEIAVHDLSGRKICSMPFKNSDGNISFTWDGTGNNGTMSASGAYVISVARYGNIIAASRFTRYSN